MPGRPWVGLAPVSTGRVGAGPPSMTVKSPADVWIPPGTRTLTGPVTAPAGTAAVRWVSVTSPTGTVPTPPKNTSVARARPVPVTVTRSPGAPWSGSKPVMPRAGAARTVKSTALTPVPPGVATAMGPVVAPRGT